MENEKVSAGVELGVALPKNLQNKSEEYPVDNVRGKREWELIVKYHGDLESNKKQIPFQVEFLSCGYAIVFIEEEYLEQFANLEQVDYIEAPTRLWFSEDKFRKKEENSYIKSKEIINTQIEEKPEQLQGTGVLVSIIDSSVDYMHPDFRNEDGTTRILALWDQTVSSESLNTENSMFVYAPPSGYVLGTLFTEEMINTAIVQPDAIQRRSIVPSVDLSGHGTHVAGIACGNGRVSDGRVKGVAPESNMLVVKLGDFEGISFPRTTRLMEAVEFSVQFAEQRGIPLVINISFGNSYGSHTTLDLLAEYLNQIATRWKTVICVGTGNEGNTGRHKEGELQLNRIEEIELSIGNGQTAFSLQLWKNYADVFQVEIENPTGEKITLSNDQRGVFFQTFSDCTLAINARNPTPFQLLQEIYLEWLPKEQYLNGGIWKFRLIPERIVEGRYDMWLPAGSNVQSQTKFLIPSSGTTLTIPSTTSRVISVGAYNDQNESVAAFSGRGYTRNLQIKPDVVASGVDILSTAPNNSYSVRSGTSMATPYVSGICALLLEYGIVQGNNHYLYGQKVKALLQKSGTEVAGQKRPNPIQGFGLVEKDTVLRMLNR